MTHTRDFQIVIKFSHLRPDVPYGRHCVVAAHTTAAATTLPTNEPPNRITFYMFTLIYRFIAFSYPPPDAFTAEAYETGG